MTSPRLQLSTEEEKRVLGFQTRAKSPWRERYGTKEMFEYLPLCPVPLNYVTQLEQALLADHVSIICNVNPPIEEEFPLPGQGRETCTAIMRNVMSELQQSWKAHTSLPVPQLVDEEHHVGGVSRVLRTKLLGQSDDTRNSRIKMQEHLFSLLSSVPLEKPAERGLSLRERLIFRLCKTANLVSEATVADLTRLSWSPESSYPSSLLTELNPFLLQFADEFKSMVLLWMQLCVLEDKLDRCVHFANTGNVSDLIQELQCVREWDVSRYPQWLTFEVKCCFFDTRFSTLYSLVDIVLL